jgi:hypothetical protein
VELPHQSCAAAIRCLDECIADRTAFLTIRLERVRHGTQAPPFNARLFQQGMPVVGLQAQDEHRLNRFSAAALKLDLLILDELGFIPFSATAAQLLFTFYSELHERVALIVTSNLKFASWVQVFGDERLTAALLDRLTAKAHILELVGESFRFRQRLHREAHGGSADRADG